MDTTQSTPTYRAMLTAAGFASEDAVWEAAKGNELGDPAQRVAKLLLQQFGVLESAERAYAAALRDVVEYAQAEQGKLARGLRADAAWMANAMRKATDAQARMQAAIDQIDSLAWIRKG